MPDPFIQLLKEKNLCSWYILPLIDLNPFMFRKFNNSKEQLNFINAYMVRGENQIAVTVKDNTYSSHIYRHSCFNVMYTEYGIDYQLFNIPRRWHSDVRKFIQGRYTKFSEEAKQKIKELSGLNYNIPDSVGMPRTDAILCALDRNQALVNKWMEVLNVPEHVLPEELLSPPDHTQFITI